MTTPPSINGDIGTWHGGSADNHKIKTSDPSPGLFVFAIELTTTFPHTPTRLAARETTTGRIAPHPRA